MVAAGHTRGVDQNRIASVAPNPNAAFTPSGLVNRIRELSGEDRAPIGVKTILHKIKVGELRASKVANRFLIRWGDYLDMLEEQRAPIVADPTVRERVERRVDEEIRRESALGGSP